MQSIIHPRPLSRRRFVTGSLGGIALAATGARVYANTSASVTQPQPPSQLHGTDFQLSIGYQPVNFTGRDAVATTVNQSLPAPTLRVREGDNLLLRVHNALAVDTSIHWHGIVLPTEMDGVPGLSFPGIKPGETFNYRFAVRQSGTYWYHAHSGHQEQTGVYGALIIDPVAPEPFHYDRDYVVLLSDWSDEDPEVVYAKLKKMSHYYNRNERTAGDLWQEIRSKGVAQTWNERAMWNRMRMSERDISDVTGYTYTFLMNGQTPARGWTGLFSKGETVRLRFINAAAMTFFDVRIPGMKMTVIAADGQYVQPVSVDEFRIGNAETYDVLVTPDEGAYTIFAQAIDRSGYACGTLTSHAGLSAEIPALDAPPILTHIDMGMAHDHGGAHGTEGGTDHGATDPAGAGHSGMDHSTMQHGAMSHGSMKHDSMSHGATNHGSMNHAAMDHSKMHHGPAPAGHSGHATEHRHDSGIAPAGRGSTAPVAALQKIDPVQIDMMADSPQYRLDDPGVGLRDHKEKYGRRVLTYADLHHLHNTPDPRDPTREIQLHLTGNMHRYLWSIDGVPYENAQPLQLKYGERVRITLINNTMMNHPFHLHGMWSDLETGDARHIPRKHTVIVQPGAKVSYLVTADAYGRWAYHCHLMYHMMMMFREVQVV